MRQQDVMTTSATPLTLIAAILLPPLALFLARGITPAFWLSVVLTLVGYIPGVVFASIAILSPRTIRIR
ncbi:MAG: hypothetical protein JWR77_1717 [Rhizorhabdus sp.]|nr:hypothetical protein [Rhizorhabdus sp.]